MRRYHFAGKGGLVPAVLMALWLLSASWAHGGVVCFDDVTVVHHPIFIKVLTKGLILPEGGRRVQVRVEDQSAGEILTGGDGYGYLKYTPRSTGLKSIQVDAELDTATGRVLVLKPGDKAVGVELDYLRQRMLFSDRFRQQTAPALQELAQDFNIIYLQGRLAQLFKYRSTQTSARPPGPSLLLQGAKTFQKLEARQVKLSALIGSPELLKSAEGHVALRFSFDNTTAGQRLSSWREVLEMLKKEP